MDEPRGRLLADSVASLRGHPGIGAICYHGSWPRLTCWRRPPAAARAACEAGARADPQPGRGTRCRCGRCLGRGNRAPGGRGGGRHRRDDDARRLPRPRPSAANCARPTMNLAFIGSRSPRSPTMPPPTAAAPGWPAAAATRSFRKKAATVRQNTTGSGCHQHMIGGFELPPLRSPDVHGAPAPSSGCVYCRLVPTREKLFEEIWAEPMTVVASRYGVSSSFLTRVCERLNVPRPERGHWAKVKVGQQTSIQPPLPAARPGDAQFWPRAGDPKPLVRVETLIAPETSPTRRTRRRIDRTKAHPLVFRSETLFDNARLTDEGYLRPRKQIMLDVYV